MVAAAVAVRSRSHRIHWRRKEAARRSFQESSGIFIQDSTMHSLGRTGHPQESQWCHREVLGDSQDVVVVVAAPAAEVAVVVVVVVMAVLVVGVLW